MRKIKKLNITTVCLLTAALMVGCNGKNKEKPEVTDNLDSKTKIESKISNNNGQCPEINKIVSMSKVDCVSTDIINRQIQYRVDAKIAKSYGIEYTLDDVMNYYTEKLNKTENTLHDKTDIADKLEADILMVGLENYARDHVMDYLIDKVEKKEKDRITNNLTDIEKQELISEYSKVYESVGMNEKVAQNAAIEDYVNNTVYETIQNEAEDYYKIAKSEIFQELKPDEYNKLSDKLPE